MKICGKIRETEREGMIEMTLAELQAAMGELNPYQIDEITAQVVKYLNLNEELKDTRPAVCPCCGKSDVQFIKKGIQAGKQRYQCKSCGRKFTYDAKQITAHSHQSIGAWITVIEDTLSLKSLDETARKIDVCHETSFNMRHKLLAFLEAMAELEVVLDELVEVDETYVVESQKGTKCKDREPRKHGEGATKPGLSHEQYCVCVATDRNDHVRAVCVNRAKPSGDDIVQALSAHIAPKCVMLCDGATTYNKLAELLQCKKVELKGYDSYDRVYHLNTVNNQHSRIKEMLRQFRGVASKYLNRYLALFTTIVSYSKSSVAESTDNLRRSLSLIKKPMTYSSSQKSGLLML